MPLKINITAQISNIPQIRNQIQRGLQDIQVSVIAASRANNQATRENEANVNRQRVELEQLNRELLRLIEYKKISQKTEYDNQRFKDEAKANILRMQELEGNVLRLTDGYRGYRRAVAELDSIRKKELDGLIKEATIRKETTIALKAEEAAIKGTYGNTYVNTLKEANAAAAALNRNLRFSKQGSKDINEYIKEVNKLTFGLKIAGVETSKIKGNTTAYGQAMKNMLTIQDKLTKAKFDESKKGQTLNKLSEELRLLNALYNIGRRNDVEYLAQAQRKVAIMDKIIQKEEALALKYEATYGKALKNLKRINDEQTKSKSTLTEPAKLSQTEKELIKLNDLYMKRNLTTAEYLKHVNALRAAEENLNSVTKKTLLQTDALKLATKFKEGQISAATYDSELKKLIADKEKLLMLDNKILSFMYKGDKQVAQQEKINAAYKGNITAAERYLWATQKLIDDTQRFASLDTKTQQQIHANRRRATDDLIRQQNELYKNAKGADNYANSLSKYFANMGMVVKKISDWLVGTTLVYGTMNQIRKAVDYVFQMDDALAELNKVTNMTNTNLENMKNKAIEMGKELGVSSIEVMKAMAEFGRVNKDPGQIAELSRYATMASKITTMSAQDAAKAFNTTMILYKKNVSDVGHILDSLNEIQNNFRTSAEDLTDSIGKVGAAAQQTGMEMENLQGYTTAIVSATGLSGSEVGTALKSIISRVYRIGEEGLGSSGDAMKALDAVGIKVTEVNGTFRDVDTVLSELNVKWKLMTIAEKQSIAQAVAGTYHYSKFISLMDNFDIALKASKIALNSTGSAINEYQVYIDSATGRLEKFKTTIEDKFNKALETEDLKIFISAITKLIEIFAELDLIIWVIITSFLAFKGTAIIDFLAKLNIATIAASGGIKGFSAALASVMNPLFVLALAITTLTIAYNYNKNAQKELIQTKKDNMTRLIEEANEVSNLKKIYADNYQLAQSDQMAKLELMNVQEKLVTIFGKEAAALDLVNGKYKEQVSLINKMEKGKVSKDIGQIQNEIEYYQKKNYGVPVLEKKVLSGTFMESARTGGFDIFGKVLGEVFGEKYKIENNVGDKLLKGSMPTKQTITQNLELLQEMKDKILTSGKGVISKEDLMNVEKYKGLFRDVNIVTAQGLKTDEDKEKAIKAINDSIEERKKDLEYIAELEKKGVEIINAIVESNLVLDEVQKQMFDSAKAGFDTSNLNKYDKELTKLANQINSPAIRGMKQQYANLNKEMSDGTITTEEYNVEVEKIKKTAEDINVDDNVINKLFRTTTDAAMALSSLEELQKAETDAASSYSKTTQNIDLLSNAYSKLLANQNLDIEEKMNLLKIYPQLSSAIDDNAQLLDMVSKLYSSQTGKVQGEYEKLLETDNVFYKDALDNSAKYFSDLYNQYQLDFTKYYNFQQLKEEATNLAKKGLGKLFTGNTEEDIKSIQQRLAMLKQDTGYTRALNNETIQILENALGLMLGLNVVEKDIGANVDNVKIAQQAKDFEAAAKAAEDSFNSIISNINELGEAMKTLQDGEKLSSETLIKLLKEYPQLGAVMGDQKTLLKELTSLHASEANAARTKFIAMMEYNVQYYNNVGKISQAFYKQLNEMYAVDFNNFQSYAQAKASIDPLMIEQYGADWVNRMDTVYADLIRRQESVTAESRDSATANQVEMMLGTVKGLKYLNDKMKEIVKPIKFDELGLDPKKEKEKADNTKILAERYRALNEALEKTNFLLSQNKEAQSGATGQNLINLLNQENKLLNIKKQNLHAIAEEKRKERQEVKGDLIKTNLGFSFTGSGDTLDITNSESILSKLAADANRHRKDTDDKYYKEANKRYEEANDLVERFYNIGSDVRGYRSDYAAVESEIKDNLKEISDTIISELEKKYKEIDKTIDKKNKEIQKTSNELQLLDDDDYKGKLDVLNREVIKSDDLISYLTKTINDLKNAKISDTEAQKVNNNKIEEYNGLLEDAILNNKQFKKTIEETTKDEDEFNKKTVKENIGKYIAYLKKQMEDYNKTLQDQIDLEEQKFDNFKRNKEKEIKAIEDEADGIARVRDEEEKLAAIRKQQALVDALKGQRTAKVYKEGEGWVMTVDIGKINEEQDKLKDLMDEYRKWQQDKAIEDRKKSLEKEIEVEEEKLRIFKEGEDGSGGIEGKIKAFEKAMDDLDKIVEDKDNYITSWNALIDSLKGIPESYYTTETNNLKGFFTNLNTAIKENEINVSPIRDKLEAMIPPELKEFFKWTDETKLPVGDKGIITKPIDTMKNEEKIAEMKKNSEDWFTASKEVQKQLEDRNMELGTSLGWTRTKKGYWEDSNKKVMYTTESQKTVNPAKMTEGRSAKKMYTYNGQSYTEEELLAQMKANSNAYNLGGNKEALSMQNAQIVQNYGLPYYKKDGVWYKNSDNTRVYEQGGIADFTGMAWVDGSKTQPERILSAAQTESFNQLVKVLPDLNLDKITKNTATESENFYIDTINVTTNDATSFINNLKKITYKRGVAVI